MNRPDHPNAFTLVELIVVITIIALLIAMLMPAMSNVRHQVRIMTCMSNVRQLNLALHAYAGDESVLPGRYTNADGPTGPGSEGWDTVLGIGGRTHGYDHAGLFVAPDVNPRRLNGYVSTTEAFRCPSDNYYSPDVDPVPAYASITSQHDWSGSSYAYNGAWMSSGTANWVLAGKHLERFKDHGRQVAWGDAMLLFTWPPHRDSFAWHDLPGTLANFVIGDFIVAPPLCNIGFLDGHAELLRFDEYGGGGSIVNGDHYIIDPTF